METKKVLLLIISLSILLSAVSFASANCAVNSIGGQKTFVEVTCLDEDGNQINNPEIDVKCNSDGFINTPAQNEGNDFMFLRNDKQSCRKQCNDGDQVTVTAVTKNGLTGYSTETIENGKASVNVIISSGTIVAGIIYNANDDDTPVENADVIVWCIHNDVTTERETTSQEDGTYSVSFTTDLCSLGDSLIVSASKGDLSGSQEGKVDYNIENWNIGIVNVPLVPEFGVIIGGLTVLGALGVFFVVRRK